MPIDIGVHGFRQDNIGLILDAHARPRQSRAHAAMSLPNAFAVPRRFSAVWQKWVAGDENNDGALRAEKGADGVVYGPRGRNSVEMNV